MSECLVVTFHYVRDAASSRFPHLKALAVADFQAHLDWLCRHYEPVDYPTMHGALAGGEVLAPRTALLTFDDGFIDHYTTVLPILLQRKLSGVFFVPTACLTQPRMLNVHRTHFLLAQLGPQRLREEVAARSGRIRGAASGARAALESLYRWDERPDAAVKRWLNYELPYAAADDLLRDLFVEHLGDECSFAASLYCNRSMLQEMSRAGMALGGHTWSHRVLSRLSQREQQMEVGRAPALIRALTAQRLVPFCYPYGLASTYTALTKQTLERAGYASGFTVRPGPVRFHRADLFELPRTDVRDLPPHAPSPVAARLRRTVAVR